jgi:hypothetical protein
MPPLSDDLDRPLSIVCRQGRGICAPWPQPAQVLAVALQLQPPPEHRGGGDLAGVREGGPALPGAVHADAQVETAGRLPGERPAGLGARSAGDRRGQGPGKHRQPRGDGGLRSGAGRRPVIWVTGDAGVVEDEQAFRLVAGGQVGDVGGQFPRRGGCQHPLLLR